LEALTNVIRHAQAKHCAIRFSTRQNSSDSTLQIEIVDDGIGFDVNEMKAGSYGMQNMHERAVEVGGTLKVVSVKNQGTRLEVKVPVMINGDGAND